MVPPENQTDTLKHLRDWAASTGAWVWVIGRSVIYPEEVLNRSDTALLELIRAKRAL